MIKVQGTLTNGHVTYATNDLYLFLRCYINAAGNTENEAIIYTDQAITNQIGAIRLPDYTFEDLQLQDGDVLTTLHNLVIEKLKLDNPQTKFSIVNIIKNEPTESEIN
jgi:hypothetical protein